MQINVSGLLKDMIGSARSYEVDEVIDVMGEGTSEKVSGEIRMIHTQRGILVEGDLQTEVTLTCSRCLEPFTCPVTIHFEEEYIATIDILTGLPLPPPDEPSAFTIDTQHVIDLGEAVRQYALLAIPMKPLCQKDCAGLCPTCGRNLNYEACACPKKAVDPRWAKLLKLLEKEG